MSRMTREELENHFRVQSETIVNLRKLVKDLDDKMRMALYEQQEEWAADFKKKCDELDKAQALVLRMREAIMNKRTCFLVKGDEHLWDRDMRVRAQLREEIMAEIITTAENV